MNADDYLALVDGWKDPNPAPQIVKHDRFQVVRDDLLGVGSKVRMLDYLIGKSPATQHIEEWVFGGCPATGYAQISLASLCGLYRKRAVLFMAKRSQNKLHAYQRRAIKLGADIRWVENGMLTVTKKRASDYAAASSSRCVLPLGLEHDTAIASMIKVARSLDFTPHEIWSAGSSGTLSRSLQLAYPDAKVCVVSVGHKMTEREVGRAIEFRSPYRFDQPVLQVDAPPFPSAAEYDAKVWSIMRRHASDDALLWNVGA